MTRDDVGRLLALAGAAVALALRWRRDPALRGKVPVETRCRDVGDPAQLARTAAPRWLELERAGELARLPRGDV